MRTVSWTRPMLERFKKAYEKSTKTEGADVFMFEGNEFVEGFAKYLIEHLDRRLPK